MKILKIELQNINSLKSESPIVIDFNSDLFIDVGLFAITGSTGAGKTTILDAITIALYHSVPRFTNSGGKGTLADVVSRGANDAFARVTFENDQIIYEAYWGIRLASKTGKKLANPQEEVSLKNLSTDTILSSQKRAVSDDVVRVTQLDYTQFLRSVMLAQGEFASFLTAKGPEKGRLLEQITGEEIYKKIGRGILERKSKEEGKLKDIQAKINADDVLSETQKTELLAKEKEINNQIETSEKKLAAVQLRLNWFNKSEELAAVSVRLEAETKAVKADLEKYKHEFDLLDLHEKAEPFKELIQNYDRNEKEARNKTSQLKNLETELAELKPEIEVVKSVQKTETEKLNIANETFNDWQPKFDLITKLDGQLKSEIENQAKTSEKLAELTLVVKNLKDEKETTQKELAKLNAKIADGNKYMIQNQFLTQVNKQISAWTADLTTLKEYKRALGDYDLAVQQRTEEVEKDKIELASNKAILEQKRAEMAKNDQEIAQIDKILAKNSLADLLDEQQKASTKEQHWKALKALAEELAEGEKELAKKETLKKSDTNALSIVKSKIADTQKLVTAQEEAVRDAQKILDLEKSMAKYEADRAHLVDGQPCSLCGSTSHPFATHLPEMDASKAELELAKRQEKLQSITNLKSELDKAEVEKATSLKLTRDQVDALKSNLQSLQLKAENLNPKVGLHNLTKIDIEINQSVQHSKSLTNKLAEAQQLQAKKDELSASAKVQNQSLDLLKTKDATLSEKIKNTKADIESKLRLINTQKQLASEIEIKLSKRLADFKYKLPSAENTTAFIQKIEAAISQFNTAEKALEKLKAALNAAKNRATDLDKQLVAQEKTTTDYTKAKANSEAKAASIKTKRIDLLPIHITVEAKREALQNTQKEWTDKVNTTQKKLQNLLDIQNKKQAVKQENLAAQTRLKAVLIELQAALDAQIAISDFKTKKDVEDAILSREDKQRYTQNKTRIFEKQVAVKAQTESNSKALAKLNAEKNFTTTEAENKLQFKTLKTKKDSLATEKGEIKEAFRKDQEIKDRNSIVYKQIEAQEDICKVWKDLFAIIGNSKEAFNIYVQRLTLKHLLNLANVHLYSLNKRYSLKMDADYKPKEELNFHLIDHYQTDQARLVDTSSGGEKFIISLALALGLSDLASKNVKIDSLFIDEGFGTLDKHTLETVISTLETLQSQGKMIGIISHVENLKERIPTQIQVTKKSNGISTVELC